MIAVDTNLLVYAHRSDSRFHEAAAAVVRRLAEGRSAWAIPWPCVHEFLAVVTHPQIYDPPSPVGEALDQVAAWMAAPRLVLLAEGEEHWRTLAELMEAGDIRGPKVHDARIAALCVANGIRELWTVDRDFSRFPVTVRNPLAAT